MNHLRQAICPPHVYAMPICQYSLRSRNQVALSEGKGMPVHVTFQFPIGRASIDEDRSKTMAK